MALASLRWDSRKDVEETKGGMYIYDGSTHNFHEWEFRTEVRWESTKVVDLKKTMSMIIEALRGEAANVAMDIGKAELMKVGTDFVTAGQPGFQKLMEGMRNMVFPFSRAEAKTLFKSGHKTKGVLSRQSGEPMVSYVSRRRRWWKKLRHMDSSVGLSDTVLGDLMLEASGLKEDQQRMILTSTANNREFEKLAAMHKAFRNGERVGFDRFRQKWTSMLRRGAPSLTSPSVCTQCGAELVLSVHSR